MERRHSFSGGQNRNKNVEGTRRGSLTSGSPEEAGNAHQNEATSSPTSEAITPGLGTVRVGTLRPECTPTSTQTPIRRHLISDLLGAEEEGKGAGGGSEGGAFSLRSIISKRSSFGMSFDKEIGKGDAFSSYTPEEKVAFARHLNHNLLGDPYLKHLLPLDSEGADLFPKFRDGVLLCRLVSLAVPGSIVNAKLNVPTGDEPLGLYKSTENQNLALKAAEAAGLQVVNIGAEDIIRGRPASILGLSWQLIRVHLLAQINLKGCPDLIHLMEDDETEEDFFKLSAETILIRWFNHHLRWAGCERRISNFADDLADGRCYLTLVKELNDKFKIEAVDDWPGEEEKQSQFRRACLVISGASGIGLAPMIQPRHITGKAHMYNTAFVAQLLNRRPRIHRERLHLPASLKMQSWVRMVLVMRRTTPVLEKRRVAGVTLRRSCRRWLDIRSSIRHNAATKVQACFRGREGRKAASRLRIEVARALEVKTKELVAAEARNMADKKKEYASKAFAEARRLEEEAAKLEAERQWAAATVLQAWLRGVCTRRAIIELDESRAMSGDAESFDDKVMKAPQGRTPLETEIMPLLIALVLKVDEIYSPRTSISSSVRFSISGDYDGASFSKGSPERSPEEPLKGSPEETVGKYPPVFPSKSPEESPERSPEKNSGEFQKESSKGSSVEVVKGSPQIPSEISLERSTKEASEIPGNKSSEGKWRGWFELFSGMSSKGMVRSGEARSDEPRSIKPRPTVPKTKKPQNHNKKREVAAAVVIQRWRRGLVEAREAAVRANEIAADRRWAVRKLHRAYANRWRFVLAARKRRRLQWEEEVQRKETRKWKLGWLVDIWGEMLSGRHSRKGMYTVKEEALFRRMWENRRRAMAKEKAEDSHCCDAIGQHVIVSEVQAWNPAYVKALVLRDSVGGKGEAQEARARELSKVGTDARAWRSPEDALSTGRFVAMISVLLTVAYESALSSAAAVGA